MCADWLPGTWANIRIGSLGQVTTATMSPSTRYIISRNTTMRVSWFVLSLRVTIDVFAQTPERKTSPIQRTLPTSQSTTEKKRKRNDKPSWTSYPSMKQIFLSSSGDNSEDAWRAEFWAPRVTFLQDTLSLLQCSRSRSHELVYFCTSL